MATRQREIIRGKILYYLALVYPQPVTLTLLQRELDLFGYPVPMDEVNFHLAYLSERELVSVTNTVLPVTQRSIRLVKITGRGIDYQDGRLPADEGIHIEPR